MYIYIHTYIVTLISGPLLVFEAHIRTPLEANIWTPPPFTCINIGFRKVTKFRD